MDILQRLSNLKLPKSVSVKKLDIDLYNYIMDHTNNLPDNTKFGLRLHAVLRNITTHPICAIKGCDNPVSITASKDDLPYKKPGYGEFCSIKCMANGTNARRKETHFKNTGYHHQMHNPATRNKQKETNRDRWGCDHYFQTKEFEKKLKQVSLEKYDVHHPAASEQTKQTRINNLQDKFGVSNVFQLEEVKQKCIESNIERWGFPNAQQNPNVRTRSQDTLEQKTGFRHPLKNPETLEKLKQTSLVKFGVTNPMKAHFTEEAIRILDDRDELKKLYEECGSTHEVARVLEIGSHRTICLALLHHGIAANDIIRFSVGERDVCKFLESIGIQYETNNRKLLSGKEIDILIEKHKLCIEYNGIYWHSSHRKDNKYHQDKTLSIHDKGYKIIHIWEDQWNDPIKRNILENKIRHLCGLNTERVYARQCHIEEINDTSTLRLFYEQHHIQGFVGSSINYGLYDSSGILTACLSLKVISNGIYDLTRYATSKTVVGGFSKLLNHFKKHHDWTTIKTYANMDYSSGDLYIKNGFTFVGITGPNYFYFKGVRYSRQQFMKNKLESKLEDFNPSITEHQNMTANGYLRCYDSGSMIFEIYK